MGCQNYGVIVRVPTVMTEAWFCLLILRLMRNMEGDTVSALVAMMRVAERDWAPLPG